VKSKIKYKIVEIVSGFGKEKTGDYGKRDNVSNRT